MTFSQALSVFVLLLFSVHHAVSSDATCNQFLVSFANKRCLERETRAIHKFRHGNLVALCLSKSEALTLEVSKCVNSIQEDVDVQIPRVERPVKSTEFALGEGEVPYGIEMVNALEVDDENASEITVCIVDGGYDINHVDLPSGVNVDGKSFFGNTGWDEDIYGHGTHVAGTIAALQNDEGVLGVVRNGNLNVRIARVFDDVGLSSVAAILEGIDWCAEQNANIISMSLGIGQVYNRDIDNFFTDMYKEDGILLIAASGNSGPDGPISFPAYFESVLSVGAIDESKNIAYFSSQGGVELVAPGVDVYSTLPGNSYGYFDGTSMACPHVAGVAALVWSHFPQLTAAEIRDVLHKSAEKLGSVPGKDPEYGYGLVNAKEAFDILNSTGSYSLSPSVSPTICTGLILAVEITTDIYGEDTSWTVMKNSIVILSGDKYAGNQTFSDSVCVDACNLTEFAYPDDLYTFTIIDSWGDGLFEEGSYTVTLDGEIKAQGGGNFGYGETKEFSDCDYSLAPSTSPTECQGIQLVVDLSTDTWGGETSWELTQGQETIMTGSDYGSSQQYTSSACVEVCDQNTAFDLYKFTIFDSFGDGMYGSYSVTLDGEIKAQGGGNFGNNETTEFSDCDYSLAPSTSPTECQGIQLVVDLSTDMWGEETSWELTQGQETIMTGSDYGSSQQYTSSACVEVCDQNTAFDLYKFTIFDSFGDGFDNGGSYTVTLDGEIKAQGGGNFGYRETTEFSDCDYSLSPTISSIPTMSPTTLSPTIAPTRFKCSENKIVMVVKLKANGWSDGFRWTVAKGGDVIFEFGGGYYFQDEYSESFCVDACERDAFSESYNFTISDISQDSDGGSYTVLLDGVVKAAGGFSKEAESTMISDCMSMPMLIQSIGMKSAARRSLSSQAYDGLCLSAVNDSSSRRIKSSKATAKSSPKLPKSPSSAKSSLKVTKASKGIKLESSKSSKKLKSELNSKSTKKQKSELNSRNSEVSVKECNASDMNQVWRVDERGYIRNKGLLGSCLEGYNNGDLVLKQCHDEFNPAQSFGITEFHRTIIALGVTDNPSITIDEDEQVRLKEYIKSGELTDRNQWTVVLI